MALSTGDACWPPAPNPPVSTCPPAHTGSVRVGLVCTSCLAVAIVAIQTAGDGLSVRGWFGQQVALWPVLCRSLPMPKGLLCVVGIECPERFAACPHVSSRALCRCPTVEHWRPYRSIISCWPVKGMAASRSSNGKVEQSSRP